MRKLKIVLLIIMIMVLFVPSTTVMAVSDPMEAASPDIPDLFDSSRNPNPYLTDYRSNYWLDDTAGMFNPVENMTNAIANVLFMLQQGLAYLLIIAFYYAFEFSIFDLFKDIINLFIGNMKGQLYDNVIIIILSFMGIFFFIKQLQRQVVQFWVALIQTVLIVALGIFYFTQPAFVLEKTETATKEISKMVLAGLNNNDTTGAVTTASNELWDIFVHRPWQMLEFGDSALAAQHSDNVLALSDPEARERIFKQLENEGTWQNMGLKRLGFQLMYLIPMLITFAILAILCGLVIMFQFLTMIIFMMGIFIFIVALIPGIGPRLLGQWFSKFVATAATKVVLVFFLSLIISFNKALFAYAETKGWLIALILQVIVYVAIFLKRNELIDLFLDVKGTIQNPGSAGRLLRTKDPSFAYAGNAGLQRNSYRRFKRRDDIGDEEMQYNRIQRQRVSGDYETYDTSDRSSEGYSDNKRVVVQNYENPQYEQPDSGATRSYDSNEDFAETMGANSNTPNYQSAAHHNEMKQYFKKAEEILEKQLEVLKQEAELKARQTGRPPEYDSRVRRAEVREKMRQPKFDRHEVEKMVSRIRTVERAGGKAEDLMPQSTVQQQTSSNPKSVMEIVRRNQGNQGNHEGQSRVINITEARNAQGNKGTRNTTTVNTTVNKTVETTERIEETTENRTRQPLGVRIRKGKQGPGGMEKKKRLTD
ncbi:MAG: CD3337/EF1877 family mobilome membrane protein [Candidatus Alkaliphilus sp. MAG34]